MTSSFLRAVLAPALLLPLLLLGPGLATARAEDPPAADPVDELLTRMEELRKAEDAAGLQAAVGEIPALYKANEDAAVRGRLRTELAKVVKDEHAGPAREEAVKAFLGLEDPKNVWKELSKAMPDLKVEEASTLDLAVVAAAGDIADAKAIKVLQDMAGKAKDPDLAAAAAQALGGYRADKKNRVPILEELLNLGKLARPGQGGASGKNVSKEASERWGLMEKAIVAALNRLTGQKVATFGDWEVLWKDYKKRPKDLFQEEAE